jgi:hypothetical protein
MPFDPRLMVIIIAFPVLIGILIYKSIGNPKALQFNLRFLAVIVGFILLDIFYKWIRSML